MWNRSFLQIALGSALMVLLLAFLHTWPGINSMINDHAPGEEVPIFYLAEAHLAEIIDYHQQQADFARRPLSTLSIKALASYTPLNLARAFVCFNFSMFWLCGILLYYSARLHEAAHRAASLSVILFYTSFSIAFA